MRHISKLHNEDGFTIIEMMLYMGILAIMLGVLSTLFASTVNMQLTSESVTSVDQSGRYIILRLTHDIHNADSITTPATLGGSGTTLTITSAGSPVTYALNGNNLTLTDSSGTYALNSTFTHVSGLSFTRLGDDLSHKNSIKINFTLTSTVKSNTGYETKSYGTTTGIR